MRRAALALPLLLFAAGAGAQPLRDGDIVFQTSRSAQSVAIQRATHSRYSHVGLVLMRDGEPYVIEAVGPVRYTPLQSWIAQGEGGHYVAKRLRTAERVLTPAAVAGLRRAAEVFAGRPYDLIFAWSDECIYCSELVWKVYDRALGVRIGRLQRLRDFDLSDPLVRTKLRERYGERIPFAEPVVSPGEMFASELLVVVEER